MNQYRKMGLWEWILMRCGYLKISSLPDTQLDGDNFQLVAELKEEIRSSIAETINEHNRNASQLSLEAVAKTASKINENLLVSEKELRNLLDPKRRLETFELLDGDDLVRQTLAEIIDLNLIVQSLENILIVYDKNRRKDQVLIATELQAVLNADREEKEGHHIQKLKNLVDSLRKEVKATVREELRFSMLTKWIPLGLLALINLFLLVLLLVLK